MPFRKVDVSEQIELLRKTDPDKKRNGTNPRSNINKSGKWLVCAKKKVS